MYLSNSFIVTIFLACFAAHPIHLTVSNVDYNEQNKNFEISIKLFQDDFEQIIKKTYSVELNLGKENQLKDAEKYIDKYIAEHLKLVVDKKKNKKLNFKEFKISELSVWLYYESPKMNKISNIQITNTLMTDLYFDQTNLLIITYKDKQKAFKFSNELLNETVEF